MTCYRYFKGRKYIVFVIHDRSIKKSLALPLEAQTLTPSTQILLFCAEKEEEKNRSWESILSL